MVAVNIARHDGPPVMLIERGGRFGAGLAYATPNPAHLLNVRAANMSAFPDAPHHFARWLDRAHAGAAFATRGDYGRYLAEQLDTAVEAHPGSILRVAAEVVGIARQGDGLRVALEGGGTLDGAIAVLATGNPPSAPPPGIDPLALGDAYAADPWRAPPPDGGTILLLGTGLTMIDSALALRAGGFDGRVVAISRRGLMPRVHASVVPQPLSECPAGDLSALVRRVRATPDWRAAIDALRPWTATLWQRASVAERSCFLRHLRPWWDVHRHRLAPEVAAQVEAMRRSGALEIVAGKTLAAERTEAGARILWRPRGADEPQRLDVVQIVNCTGTGGPEGDALLARLVSDGVARVDPLGLGLDVDADGAVRGPLEACLYAVGPPTRGASWEITAVPDIRRQAWALARKLANAHWEEGEGL
jgi:uncharacterized NAD(P)/FAD-binding protein YdhS